MKKLWKHKFDTRVADMMMFELFLWRLGCLLELSWVSLMRLGRKWKDDLSKINILSHHSSMCGFSFWMHPIILLFLASSSHHNTQILHTCAQNTLYTEVYPKGRFCEHAIPSWQNAHFHARPFKSCIHTRKIVSTLRFTLRDDSANTQSPSDKTHAFMLEAWNPAYRPSKCSPYWGLP